jgi:hypothetical protein
LYREPSIKFGGQTVGGIRISHMSHLPDGKRVEVLAQVTRGKREKFTVDPLPEQPAAPSDANQARLDGLRAEWQGATPERRVEIETEVGALTEGAGR